MKSPVRQIAALTLILILFLVACRLTLYRSYQLYLPIDAEDGGRPRVLAPDDGVVQVGGEVERGRYVRVPISPQQAGETDLIVSDGRDGYDVHYLRVDRFRTVYDRTTGGFTGDNAVLAGLTLFFLSLSVIMTRSFLDARGPRFYAYSTIYYAGFSIFSLVTGLTMLNITLRRLVEADSFDMLNAYQSINSINSRFMMLTMPLVVVFAILMAVSNIALLRHERPRPANILGILVSLMLLLGEAVGVIMYRHIFGQTHTAFRAETTLEGVYATCFVYFECMLAGSVICGVHAARYEPEPDKDFIIILGCWFRRDGTLPPLIRGRVERALTFWRHQKAKTGKTACFIPSGGQGKNETMPEAEAMRRYLLSHGVPDSMIIPETRSRNTYENMEFSRDIIRSVDRDASVVYATTNYHVFRSGVWAGLAGLPAEGIGGRTKWWFWPNAFMRECAGLLKNRWKQELILLLLLICFFYMLSAVLTWG